MGYLFWDMISNHIQSYPNSQKISLNILTYPYISYHIPTYPRISSGANSQMSKGWWKFRVLRVWRSLNFVWKSLMPSQSHCRGSGSIEYYTRWDSGHLSIIIPAQALLSEICFVGVLQKNKVRIPEQMKSNFFSRACDTFGWLCLDSESQSIDGKRWKTDYKDSEAHLASFAATWRCRATHASERSLSTRWLRQLHCTKLERWRGYLFSVPVYNLLEHFLSRFQM
jgi:hypothetical protein